MFGLLVELNDLTERTCFPATLCLLFVFRPYGRNAAGV